MDGGLDAGAPGRWLIGLGGVLVVVGFAIVVFGRVAFFGRLPGDIAIERAGLSVHIPLVSMLVVSIALSVLITIAARFFR